MTNVHATKMYASN